MTLDDMWNWNWNRLSQIATCIGVLVAVVPLFVLVWQMSLARKTTVHSTRKALRDALQALNSLPDTNDEKRSVLLFNYFQTAQDARDCKLIDADEWEAEYRFMIHSFKTRPVMASRWAAVRDLYRTSLLNTLDPLANQLLPKAQQLKVGVRSPRETLV